MEECCRAVTAQLGKDPASAGPALRKLCGTLGHLQCHRLSKPLVDSMLQALLRTDSERLQVWVLLALCLEKTIRDVSGLSARNMSGREAQLPFVLALLFSEMSEMSILHMKEWVSSLVKWVSTVGYPVLTQTSSVTALLSLTSNGNRASFVNRDQVHIISAQMGEWLRNAGLSQASNPYAKSFFRKDREQKTPVTEIDGTVSKDTFTILCIGQYYTDDQLLNIHAFSALRRWILHTYNSTSSHTIPSHQMVSPPWFGPATPPSHRVPSSLPRSVLASSFQEFLRSSPDTVSDEDALSSSSSMSEADGLPETSMDEDRLSISSSLSECSISSGIGAKLDPFTNSSVKYCLRLLKQGIRKPKVHQDYDLQQAALVEGISIVDCLCQTNPLVLPKVFEPIKHLMGRVRQSQPRPILAIMQFFIHHSVAMGYDPSPLYRQYFQQVLPQFYSNPAVTFDTLMFLKKNLDCLCYDTELLSKFFPAILKILAWNARSSLCDFMALLPAMLSPVTTLEVFHSLLDLPCLAAALELSRPAHSASPGGIHVPQGPGITAKGLEALNNPQYKPLLGYILRNEGGVCDTIDRLSTVHLVLEDLKHHPRVLVCADAAPLLLRLLIQVVTEEADMEVAGRLVPVMMERVALLYNIPQYQAAVRSELCTGLVGLFKKHPELMVELYTDMKEHLSAIRSSETDMEDFNIHLIWLTGEYLSPAYDEQCSPEHVAKMYETLETLAYENTGGKMGPTGGRDSENAPASPRFISVLMSAIAKLASRSQDLIPRAMLCITKLGQQSSSSSSSSSSSHTDAHRTVLKQRAAQLVSLLKLPNVAAAVLSPPAEVKEGWWHSDGASLPVLLRLTTSLLHDSASAVAADDAVAAR